MGTEEYHDQGIVAIWSKEMPSSLRSMKNSLLPSSDRVDHLSKGYHSQSKCPSNECNLIGKGILFLRIPYLVWLGTEEEFKDPLVETPFQLAETISYTILIHLQDHII